MSRQKIAETSRNGRTLSRGRAFAWLLAGALLVVCHGGARGVAAQTYSVTDLGTLGGNESDAKDINDAGRIVGYAKNAAGQDRAFLWRNGSMTDLGTLGGTESWALAINSLGRIVGEAEDGTGNSRAFRWASGTGMTDLGTLGGDNVIAWDINDAGWVVGQSETGAMSGGVPVVHAFLRMGAAAMQDIGALAGGDFAQATGINTSGEIVGWSQTTGVVGFHAFRYPVGGPMADIGAPGLGGDHSGAMAIDDAGTIVGEAEPAGGGTRPFRYASGTMTDLGSLGGTVSRAMDIGPSGQIVGWSHVAGGTVAHAFVYDAVSGLRDLNTLIPAGSGWLLVAANAINESGWIVGYGEIGGEDHAFLLKPQGNGGCCLPAGPMVAVGLILGLGLLVRVGGARARR